MTRDYVYGHIANIPFGTPFTTRDKLSKAGVHAPTQAGIHGDSNENGGAYSICLSQGYEDNVDKGDTITYVGSGGQDQNGQQVMDQSFDDPPNRSLLISCETKRPVRVIRGKNEQSFYAPAKGYRYDGLYVVDSARMARGKRGFNMCIFELRRIMEDDSGPIPNRRRLNTRRLNSMLRGASRR